MSDEQAFNVRWGWYNSFLAVAGEDYLKIGEAQRLNVFEFLTALSHQKEYSNIKKK